MSEKTDARVHTAGDGSNCRARADDRAFWAWWGTAPQAPTCRCLSLGTCSCIERQAFKAGWKAATRHKSVDGVHPGQARKEA